MNKDIAASDLVLNADTLIKIIDKLPHVVYLKDSQHRFLLANKACLAMLNSPGEEVIGQTDQNFHIPAYVKYVHDVENSVIRNGEKVVVPEERFIDPTGTEQIMKTTRLPFYISELNEIGILAIAVNMAKEKEMEDSIRFQNEVLQKQKEEIDEKRKIAEELYNKVRNGLKASKFMQEAILPNEASVKRILPNSFVLYKPKKYTNGDFYWVKEKDGLIYIATIDCTEFDAGGTFIAMLCYDLLSQVVKEKYKPTPTEIIYEINEGLKSNLDQSVGVSEMKERVYINICVLDKEKYFIEQSGSGAPMLLINKYSNFLMESKNTKQGLPFDETQVKYIDNRVRITKGDVLYLMTNGLALQKTKLREDKEILGHNRLKNLILDLSDATMDKQLLMLNEFLSDFMGEEDQTDDIVLIGVRI